MYKTSNKIVYNYRVWISERNDNSAKRNEAGRNWEYLDLLRTLITREAIYAM